MAAATVCMCVYLRGRSRGVNLFLSSPSLSHDQFDLFGLSEFLPWHVYVRSRVQLLHCLSPPPPINLWQQRIRLKCDLLFSLPSFLVFLAVVRYLLSVGLTLVHSSLAFCQTWFLTAAFPPFFSSSSSAAVQFLSSHLSPFVPLSSWLHVSAAKRFSTGRTLPFLQSFVLFFLPTSPSLSLSLLSGIKVC